MRVARAWIAVSPNSAAARYVVVYDKDRQMKEIRLHPLAVSPGTPPRMIGLSIALSTIRDFFGESAKHVAVSLLEEASSSKKLTFSDRVAGATPCQQAAQRGHAMIRVRRGYSPGFAGTAP